MLDRCTVILLLLMWIYTAFHFNQLPDTIPVHFNVKGETDRFGSKYTIWLLPLIVTGVAVFLGYLSRFPHTFNYPQNFSEKDAEKQYKLATRLLRILRLIIGMLFTYINFRIIYAVNHNHSTLDGWFIPVLIVSLVVPTLWYIYQSGSGNKSHFKT
jgi:uncharacterized membrane protein